MTKPIVIIDDLDTALQLTKSMLINAGYSNVLAFDCPIQALREMKDGLQPSLVITDYRMPDMNGLELLMQVNALYPNTKAVVITGDPTALENIPIEKLQIIEKGSFNFFKNLLSFVRSTLPNEITNDRKSTNKVTFPFKSQPSNQGKQTRKMIGISAT